MKLWVLLAVVVAVGSAVFHPTTAQADDPQLNPPTELAAYRASEQAIVVTWTPSRPAVGVEVLGYEVVGGGSVARNFGADADFVLVSVDDASTVSEVVVTAFGAGGAESPMASVEVREPIVGVDVPAVDDTIVATPVTSALVGDEAVFVGTWLSGDGRWLLTAWRSELLVQVVALDLTTGQERLIHETGTTCCAPVQRVSDTGRVLLVDGEIVDLVTGERTPGGPGGFDERTGERFELDARPWIRTFDDDPDPPRLLVDLRTSELLRDGEPVPQGPPLADVELRFSDQRLGVFAIDRPVAMRLAVPFDPELGTVILLDEYDGEVMRRRIAGTFERPGFRGDARADVGAFDGALEHAAFTHLGRHYVAEVLGDRLVRVEGVERPVHLSNDGSIALFRTSGGAAYVDLTPPPAPPEPVDESPLEQPPVDEPTSVPADEPLPDPGYWMAERTGALYGFGAAVGFEPTGSQVVSIATEATGSGLWVLRENGEVETRGAASHHGDVEPTGLDVDESVTTISVRPGGDGYWVFTDRGRALAFGAAQFFGDMSAVALNGPVVASAAAADGEGYWLVAADGGIFSFGSAEFAGSTGSLVLNEPVVGIATDPDGEGYWLVAADGGIFAFDAEFLGSMPGVLAPGVALNAPVVGALAYGDGYLMVASDGGIFNFSDQRFLGSLGGRALDSPVVGVAAFAG